MSNPTHDILAEVRERKNFYRDYYRKGVRLLWVAMMIILLLILAIILLKALRSYPPCYVNSSAGQIELIPTYTTLPYRGK